MAVVTLTMNPAVDILVKVARVVPAQKLRCTEARRDAGGGGINVARVISRLGGSVRAIYPVGGPVGHVLRHLVEADGLSSEIVPISHCTRESFTVQEEETEEQYRFVLPGPELTAAEIEQCLEAAAKASPAPSFFAVSGSLPAGAPADFFARAIRQAKGNGARTAVDSSGSPLAAALETGVFLLKANLQELQDLMGTPLPEKAEWLAACRTLVAQGKTCAAALTLGARGSLLVTSAGAYYAPPLEVRPVSTVGAGDSFLGAMLWALDTGAPLEEAFRYGTAAATATLLVPGTGLCRREDVLRLFPEVRLEAV